MAHTCRKAARPAARRMTVAGLVALVPVLIAGCSVSDNSSSSGSSASGAAASSSEATSAADASSGSTASGSTSASPTGNGQTVTLVTHDSWVMDKTLTATFEKQTGYKLKVVQQGDAGKLANSLVLTKGSPVGDVTFGVDTTFATRVVDAGALEDYSPALPTGATTYALKDATAAKQLTPIDFGDVCVNVDNAWFTKNKKNPPTSLDDLTKSEYKNLFVTPGAATSSPGMAFLLATISKYGESGWQDYWKKLMANGAKLTSGWDDAWGVDYTAGGGNGSRPIVLSYNTSPADTIKNGKATTSALMNTCFEDVEYAGVLKGAKNTAGAKAFIDFMLGKDFQTALPGAMYVDPVDSTVALPDTWKTAVQNPTSPLKVDPATITKNRDTWLREWQDVTGS